MQGENGTAAYRLVKDRGTPIAVYIRMFMYTKTWKQFIDLLNEKGSCISHDFRGTSIPMFQHLNMNNKGEKRPPLQRSDVRQAVKFLRFLNPSLTEPAIFNKKNLEPHQVANLLIPDLIVFRKNLVPGYASVDITWSVHHASQRKNQGFKVGFALLFSILKD